MCTHVHPPTRSTSTLPTLADALITATPSSKSSIWSRTEVRAGERWCFKRHFPISFWHIGRIFEKDGETNIIKSASQLFPGQIPFPDKDAAFCSLSELVLIITCVHLVHFFFLPLRKYSRQLCWDPYGTLLLFMQMEQWNNISGRHCFVLL